MPEGTVRWFDAERGFGFIDLGDEGDDLFVHASELVDDDGPRVLREGQTVEFELGEGDRGPIARRVRVTGDLPADAPLGVLGTVSWYEPAKGYGFVEPEGGGTEIFVHSSAIVGGGVISEGQRVAFLVVDGEKGPQADHLLPLGSPAAGPVDDGADGTVSWFDDVKGFGFIRPDGGGDDVFVHASSLGRGVAELFEGDRVTYETAEGDRGPQARDVQLVRAPGSRSGRGGSWGGGGRAGDRDRDRGDRDRGRGRDDRGRGFGDRGHDRGHGGERGYDRGHDRGRAGGRGGGPVRGGVGTVARYDDDRGFGFITPDDGGDDLFVHVSVVLGGEELEQGDRVRYQVRQSDRGPQADDVELI